jgi:hypothetical protein
MDPGEKRLGDFSPLKAQRKPRLSQAVSRRRSSRSGATSIVTSEFTAPRSILRIIPASALRALTFMEAPRLDE